MRFLLINPFCPIAEGPTPPLGISFLAAALERAGIEVKVLDFVVYPYTKEVLEAQIKKFKPDIVGASAVTMTFYDAIKVISDVKSIDQNILTVMGGPHVSFCAEETLSKYPELDLIAIGEGEETIVDLSEEFERKRDWSRVKSLVFRNGNSIIVNERRELLDVNTLPLPARHLIPLGRYKALNTPISMTTSRGCPHKCIFCIGRKMVGAKVRYRNPMAVVDELEYLSSLGFPQINISDDLFTAKKSHCLAICDEIIKRKLKIRWSSFARVDTVSDEVLKKMKEAGCTAVSFGVETANKDILKTIKKGITIEKVKKAMTMCANAGMIPHVSFILGLPGETPDTLIETQNFGKEIEQLGASFGFHLLAPFPGTAVRDENSKFDLDILTEDWSQYHANRAIVETSAVKKEMLNEIAEKWEKGAHELYADMRRRMNENMATEEETWQINNFDRFIFLYDLMMKNIIEKNGSWINHEEPKSDTDALNTLAVRIHSSVDKTKEQVRELLDYAFARGSIAYSHKNKSIHWEWQNYL